MKESKSYVPPRAAEVIKAMKSAKGNKTLVANRQVTLLLKEKTDEGKPRTPETVLMILTKVRKQLSKEDGNLLRLPADVMKGVQVRMKLRRDEKKKQYATMDGKDYSYLIKKCVEGLESSDPYAKTLSLCLLTGRRTAEILGAPCFKKSKQAKHLSFSGQIKSKGLKDAFDIPVLGDPAQIIKAQISVSTKLSNDEINRKYAMGLSRLVKSWLAVPTVHTLRSIYVALTFSKFKVAGDFNDKEVYANRVLGHYSFTASGDYANKVKQVKAKPRKKSEGEKYDDLLSKV